MTDYDTIYLDRKRTNSGHLFDEIPDAVIGEQIDCMQRTSNREPRFGRAVTPRNFR